MTEKLFKKLGVMLAVASMLPASAQTYTGEQASVVWPFNSASYATDVTSVPENAFAIMMFDQGDCTFKKTTTTTMCPDITFVDLASKNGASDIVKWQVKPAKGLTFTPTSVSFYIGRDGTDGSGNDVTVRAETAEGKSETFGQITPHRINKTTADDKLGNHATYTIHYEYTLTAEQQQALKTSEGFYLVLNNGYGNTKGCCYSDVHINGTLDGTVVAVAKYTVAVKAEPAAAGDVTINPLAPNYDEGTVVTLNTTKKFGYRFVNWTDSKGTEVSRETSFTHTVTADEAFTANYEAVPTYSMTTKVEGGANDYMVQLSPAPTVVNDKNMYEDGTVVTLTAISNPIMKFTNWSDGQSSGEITVNMNEDKVFTANYTAEEFVVGWDFMLAGNNGRPADFASADNDAASLTLRDADGNTTGWLDKSQLGAGGYEGRPGGVNWKTDGLGKWYWETKVNASSFTDLRLVTAMVFNYNAYTKYNVEYSLDGSSWQKVGTLTMEGSKSWTDGDFTFPAACNNQPQIFIRWIADKTSDIKGTTSDNDGICLGATYLFGKEQLVDDGTAPVLVSFIPAEGADNASINGRVVLTFDEKVKTVGNGKATLGGEEIAPEITGKVALFPYKNLSYGTKYTFTLPAGSIADLTDNAITKDIKINFTTKTRPAVTKADYDFIVPDNGSLLDAIAAATARENNSVRYRVFIRNGSYKLPASDSKTKTGSDGVAYPDPTTYVNTPNISFIGESTDGVVITNSVPPTVGNANVLEGIGNGDVMRLEKNATGTYFQNLTMKSSMGDKRGRDIVLNDNSDKTIIKDACLWAYQDTYVSNNDKGRFYFEGGVLRGRTDFLCGKGDVYYNRVTLQMVGAGYLAVPSVPRKYGYIFKDCEIVGEKDKADGNKDPNGNYKLGRPWGSGTPIALFIDTKMIAQPAADGWNEMGTDGFPKRFAEYNSMTAQGSQIDLSKRKKTFGNNHANNPVLTKAEADAVSYEIVMGDGDDWDPASAAEQAPAPTNVALAGNNLTWDNNDYVLLWAVVKNGNIVDFTTIPAYAVDDASAEWAVRAANEMGGLGEAIKVGQTGIDSIVADTDAEIVSTVYYNAEGMQVDSTFKGFVIKVDTLSDGSTVATKTIL